MSPPSPTTPGSVDLRAVMAPVRDQGQRGTCVAFAASAAHEVARGGLPPEDLAEEALYWGCKRIDGNWTSGTTFGSASTALGRWGQPAEVDWPYDPTRTDGVAYSPPSRTGGSGWFRTGLRRIGAALSDVRTHLDAGTPVLLGLTVFDTFYRPDAAGQIADPPAGAPARGRHAVLAIGYQTGALLIRNSWGATWALAGYAWIGESYVGAHTGAAWIVDGTTATGKGAGQPHRTGAEGETYGTR